MSSTIPYSNHRSVLTDTQNQQTSSISREKCSHSKALVITSIVLAVLVGTITIAASVILCPTFPAIIIPLVLASLLLVSAVVGSVWSHEKTLAIKKSSEKKPVTEDLHATTPRLEDIQEEPAVEKPTSITTAEEATTLETPALVETPASIFNHGTLKTLLNKSWQLEITEKDLLYRSKTHAGLTLCSRISNVYDPLSCYTTPEAISNLGSSTVWVQQTLGTPNLGRGSSDIHPERGKNVDAIRIPEAVKQRVSTECQDLFSSTWLQPRTTVSVACKDESSLLPTPAVMTFTRFTDAPENINDLPQAFDAYTAQYKEIIEKSLQTLLNEVGKDTRTLTVRLPVMGLVPTEDPIYRDDDTITATSFMTRASLLQALEELSATPTSLLSSASFMYYVCIEICDEEFSPLGSVNESSLRTTSEREPWSLV